MFLRIAGIVNDSIVDGPGLRLTIFVQGCKRNCYNCHNPQTHDLNGGRLIDAEEIIKMIDKNVLLDGVTFSGGEPFLQTVPLIFLAKKIKERKLSLIVYTGFKWEELIKYEQNIKLLNYVDYLIDGEFINSLKSLELNFRGSSNQRIIDVQKSLHSNNIFEHEF